MIHHTSPEFIARREILGRVGSTNDVVRGWLADGTAEVCVAVASSTQRTTWSMCMVMGALYRDALRFAASVPTWHRSGVTDARRKGVPALAMLLVACGARTPLSLGEAAPGGDAGRGGMVGSGGRGGAQGLAGASGGPSSGGAGTGGGSGST